MPSFPRFRLRNRMVAETALEMTVAMATPSTVIPTTRTKNRFRITLMIPETDSTNSGVLVSPWL